RHRRRRRCRRLQVGRGWPVAAPIQHAISITQILSPSPQSVPPDASPTLQSLLHQQPTSPQHVRRQPVAAAQPRGRPRPIRQRRSRVGHRQRHELAAVEGVGRAGQGRRLGHDATGRRAAGPGAGLRQGRGGGGQGDGLRGHAEGGRCEQGEERVR
ncbi:hypothetical protein TPAR_06281, partial [Tolypocladium paradoxum]